MKIEEKMIRRSQEDVIEIGQVMEKFYNGQAGSVFRAIVNAIILENVSSETDVHTPADRRLGRAEGANKVRDFIEMAILDMKKLTTPLPAEEDGNG